MSNLRNQTLAGIRAEISALQEIEKTIEQLEDHGEKDAGARLYCAIAARSMGVPFVDPNSRDRSKPQSDGRMLARWLAYQLVPRFKAVGRMFGCDHGTVIHSVNQVEAWDKVQLPRLFKAREDALKLLHSHERAKGKT